MSTPLELVQPSRLDDALVNGLARVYLAAFGAPEYGEAIEDVQRFVDEQLPKHAERDGFKLVVASQSGLIVGFAYGYTGQQGQWWTDRVAERAPADVVTQWVGGHFEFVELAVDRHTRSRASARRFTTRC